MWLLKGMMDPPSKVSTTTIFSPLANALFVMVVSQEDDGEFMLMQSEYLHREQLWSTSDKVVVLVVMDGRQLVTHSSFLQAVWNV